MEVQTLFPAIVEKTITIGDKPITVRTGEMARAANGSVTVQCFDTMVMVTACASKEPRPNIDFFPLLVDYEEKMFSVGRLPGGFIKREGRPSEKAVLTSRLIDRPIRPLWPDGYRNDVQIVATPLSAYVMPPDTLAIFGASCALTLAGLPFQGPIGAVRVGIVDGDFVFNPTYEESDASELDLVVAGTADSIMMVEAGCTFVSEETLLKAIELAHDEIRRQCDFQVDLARACGVEKKEYTPDIDLTPLQEWVLNLTESDLDAAFHIADKDVRSEKVDQAKAKLKEAIAALAEDSPIKAIIDSSTLNYAGEAFKKVEKKVMRRMILNENVRADGRKPDEIRPISARVGLVPRAHGSALFTRGNTQVLSICTLGSPGDAQELDGIDPLKEKRFMHHYNFPGFSVGEVKPLRGAGRREIGHGALAERANLASLPTKEQFAYTIRVNSEVIESNGSTSMASTCGASLAMMDAAVPIKSPIGGIAMGLIKENSGYKVLSDILGVEDFLGDMDFKVTGNEDGVTALQMDIKIQGISIEIMREALEQARKGRLHIIGKMTEALSEPRTTLSPYAPRIITMRIEPSEIGMIIGPGGKNIRGIIEETGAAIDIEDSGLVTITSSGSGGERAKEIIERMTMKVTSGLLVVGKVVRIIPAGAFIELTPGKDGMVHISQIVNRRVNKVEDVLSVGDRVLVKVNEIDDRGRINLTMKGLTEDEKAGYPDITNPE